MQQSLLILGASARAAAWSASRTDGVVPYCIDLFADCDLRYNCTARALAASEYPQGFIEAARLAPPGPWIYTGALENHPKIIEAIARERPLWGIGAKIVRKVRFPSSIAEVLQRAGLPCPAVAETPRVDAKKVWLVKRLHSAGGAYIHPWQGQALARGHYLQERIEGTPCAAIFVGRRKGSPIFLGATRQLIGINWLHADGFRYCGNIGPLRLPATASSELERLGNVIATSFGLLGLFGVDFILNGDVSWPVEINPRYTASVEVLERASNRSLFAQHRDAFEPGASLRNARAPHSGRTIHGKSILFAKAPLVFPADGPWGPARSWNRLTLPEFADVPPAQSRIAKGQPIMTLFAEAKTESDCLESLRKIAQALDRRLFH